MRRPTVVIGVDLDNTIVSYDGLFWRLAREHDLIPADIPATKGHVRDYLRRTGREGAWTEIQGIAYGPRITEADAFEGAVDFFLTCRRMSLPVVIITHKTRRPQAPLAYDLRSAARDWLAAHGFHDPDGIALQPGQIHFEETRAAKLARIAAEGCTHFIDDLPEVFDEPGFPSQVNRILFDPGGTHRGDTRFQRVESWSEVYDLLDPQGLRRT